jgi:predicted RNase H-like HicB family nuclease
MLDFDLAQLYEVETKALNLAVKRNLQRFPDDFMFQLTNEEWVDLRLQNETLDKGRGKHTKYLPYAFTEQGLAMLSGILFVNYNFDKEFIKVNAMTKTLKYIVQKEGKYYVSQCLNVDVSSFGNTVQEAIDNLNEALMLYFEDKKE